MSAGDRNRNTKRYGSRLLSALVVILLLAGIIFITSDIPFVKGARDSLFGKLGYVSEDVSEGSAGGERDSDSKSESDNIAGIDPDALPEYNGKHYVRVNGDVPEFPSDVYERGGGTADSKRFEPYEYYGNLDPLGRCTYAYGCLGEETMPARSEERGDISSVHPSGWAKAQNWERCHLIAWALGAENANPSNLITGTHYLNYDGMRPLEEEVEHYIWNTGNHVLYYAKPWFAGDEAVARGVQLIAKSVEDGGKGISFNVYCFNVTPNAEIDYKTGIVTTQEQANQAPRLYVINTRSGVFHYPSCDGVKDMSEHNRKEVTATRKELTDQGYTPCGSCEP
jgi:DNA-entry nuclease